MNFVFIAVSIIASFLITWVARFYSARKNIIDVPNERSSHDNPTPRGGGVAIVIVWFVGSLYLFIIDQINSRLFIALSAGLILSIISILDDLYDIKPILRIIIQFFSAAIALLALGGIDTDFIPGNPGPLISFITFLITLVGIVWFINLYNFLDGIDAYASIEAIAISIAFLLLTGTTLPFLLIAAVLGFLIWNWPKAKIFMGDVGSTQLGFIIAILAIYYHNENSLSILWSGALTAPFWVDATLTLFRRWRNREKLSQAHRKHAYQRFVQHGFSHLKVDIMLISINMGLLILVYLALQNSWSPIPVLVGSILFVYICIRVVDRLKPFPKD